MRDQLRPYVAAIFSAILGVITVAGNMAVALTFGSLDAGYGISSVFYFFLPMSFYFVGVCVAQLQQENRELRAKIDELALRQIGEAKVRATE